MSMLTIHELCEYIGSLKVADLKEHIKAFNERLPFCPHMRLSGNKPDLAQRLIEAIIAAAAVPEHFEDMLVVMAPLGLTMWLADVAHLHRASQQYAELYGHMPSSNATSTSTFRPQVAARPSTSSTSAATPQPAQALSQGSLKQLRFWPSPFYDVIEFVSSIVQIPEAPPPSGRRQVGVSFTLSQKQVDQLTDTQHTYQLRLFCTTFQNFMASVSPPQKAVPIEFPFTCEARINERSLGVSLKGNKKHAGRVAPPNLNRNRHLHVHAGKLNRVELSYANSPNRYTMVIALCKVTSAETLTAQLKQKQYRSKESVIAMMQRKAQDEEIETGASTLRLTCPLTYVRMVTPCRANTCDHIQCFDALSFYSMNEQSPQWQCPVCSQDIKSEDLRMDGYVEDILRRVPHDLEAVLVEADGSWHSADDKYTSDSPILAEPSAPETEALDLLDLTPSPPPSEMASTIPPSFVAKAEVATPPVGGDSPMLSLDMSATSFSTPRISPIRPGPTLSTLSTPPPPPPANVIDLTLSSDDES